MADKRITKRDRFAEIREILLGEIARGEDVTELVEFVDNEVTLLNKKAASPRVSKSQVENLAVKSAIIEVLEVTGTPLRSSAIAEKVGISVQKSTALLRQLVESGAVRREVDKKVTTFTV